MAQAIETLELVELAFQTLCKCYEPSTITFYKFCNSSLISKFKLLELLQKNSV